MLYTRTHTYIYIYNQFLSQKSYSCCNLFLHQRCGQGHLLIYFPLSLCGTNALNSTNFPSINCIRQMECFHPVSKSCWARLMFSLFLGKTLAASSPPRWMALCACVHVVSSSKASHRQSSEVSAALVHQTLIIALERHKQTKWKCFV